MTGCRQQKPRIGLTKCPSLVDHYTVHPGNFCTVEYHNPQDQLAEWQHYYNWDRPHSVPWGNSPMERFFELIHQTPFSDEVDSHYVPEKERIRDPNYRLDLQLNKLKRSLWIVHTHHTISTDRRHHPVIYYSEQRSYWEQWICCK